MFPSRPLRFFVRASNEIYSDLDKPRIYFLFLILICSLGLSACATEPGGIFKKTNLTNDESVLIGARKRAILNTRVGEGSRPGLVNPKRVVCAEPSPDVALAVAQSLGVGLSVLWGGGQGAVSGSGASTEGIGQLGERTQAIQLLRDQMYRACEAYANGAITGTTYNLIMSRNNDAMVTLMIAGVAGGEFGRSGLAIGGSASSEASASVTSLLEVIAAADKAAEELAQAETAEEAAETNLENQEAAGASATDVEDAEDQVVEAREEVRRRQERKNDADTKARAEITKVVGAGSIAAKPSLGVGRVLEQMQSNFLREDFADEYVAACIVEMGLANAGAPEFLREAARAEDVARANLANQFFTETDLSGNTERSKKFTEFITSSRTAERYTLFARHCRDNLFSFIVFASSSERALEQERLRLDTRRAVLDGEGTRKETLALYAKLIADCQAIKDDAASQQCLKSVATIVERPDAVFELAAVAPVETPSPPTPALVVSFDRAAMAKEDFDKKAAVLEKEVLPTVGKDTMFPDDAKALNVEEEELEEANTSLKDKVNALETTSKPKLEATEREKLVKRQTDRQALEDSLALLVDASKDEVAIATTRLTLHDLESKETVKNYVDLRNMLEDSSKAIEGHLKAIKALVEKIEAAKKRKAEADKT